MDNTSDAPAPRGGFRPPSSRQPATSQQPAADQPTEQQVVGKRLRTARETLGLTQDDVAGALGIPRTSVIAMEAGRRNVSALELRRLARLYRRNVQWLLGEEDDNAAVDSALFRATAELSEDDKEQVLRFAQFLASAGPPPAARRRRAAPAAFGRGSKQAEPPEGA
ncbi:helix-turn-helix domain-containing protein [Umezawaea sp. Da 62-37]|uniref:helix-turn-helix domain-containing protein n=1 Tax=Umezawaea sp. Da 62-37 TaxID=3075927 RepID=UPI0028F72FEC|nr:helix-turn-helix domain-containing protein [Umezawaea sp. Da 62-37]WNV82887.1 helix-turn-helix domain-containing protein [Umezawaea sp. Da 62-37]